MATFLECCIAWARFNDEVPEYVDPAKMRKGYLPSTRCNVFTAERKEHEEVLVYAHLLEDEEYNSMSILSDRAVTTMRRRVEETLAKVSVSSGACRFNYRCQMNAVHEALEGGHDKIAMCYYIDNGRPIIHFLNVLPDGTYVDNTLGRWSEIFTYYLVRYIPKEEFFKVNSIFSDYRKEIRKWIPLYIRVISSVEF